MANTGAMIGKQHQIRNSPVSITFANSPYTVPANISEVNVDTTGGNVRVNLPNTDRTIVINKTSSDSYLVTLFVAGTQIGEIAGERSSVIVESGQITKDEPWYPYDMIVGIAGASGDGGEIIAKNKFGKCLSSNWRGVAGTDDSAILNIVFAIGGHMYLKRSSDFLLTSGLIVFPNTIIESDFATLKMKAASNINTILTINSDNVSLRGLIIDSNKANNTAGEQQVLIGGKKNIVLEYNTFKNSYEHGVVVYNNVGDVGNITILHNQFSGNNKCGLRLSSYGSNVLADGNTFRNNCTVGDLIGDIYAVSRTKELIITNNRIYDTAVGNVGNYNVAGVHIRGILDRRVDILHNMIDNAGCIGILTSTHNPTVGSITGSLNVVDNTVGNCTSNGIYIEDCRAERVSGNRCFRNRIGIGVAGTTLVQESKECSVSENNCYENFGHGIALSEHCTAIANICKNNGTDPAFAGYFRAGMLCTVPNIVAIGNKLIDDQTVPTQQYGISNWDGLGVGGQYGKFELNIFSGNVVAPFYLNTDVGNKFRLNEGYNTENSGSSTGTGSEQTIAHGLAAIPTGCKAWIRYPISATVYAEKEVDMDATNIYPKVKTGLAYDWRVE
jgi:hypothetical protein